MASRKDQQAYMKEWLNNLRTKVRANLGDKCSMCGTTNNLNLHHKYYESDSIKPSNNSYGMQRLLEADKHPERFELVCAKCHIKTQNRNYFRDSKGRFAQIEVKTNV